VASPPWFIFLHECIDLHRGQVLMRVFTQCLIEIDIMRRCMPLVLPFTGRADLARHPTFVTAYIWHTRSEEEVVEQEHVVAARAIIAISAKGIWSSTSWWRSPRCRLFPSSAASRFGVYHTISSNQTLPACCQIHVPFRTSAILYS